MTPSAKNVLRTVGGGQWALDTGHWTLDTGHWTLDTFDVLTKSKFSNISAKFRKNKFRYRSDLNIGKKAAIPLVPIVHCSQPIAHYLLPIAHYLLPTVRCPLSTVYCPLSSVYCQLVQFLTNLDLAGQTP
jgi:hypothetical protein